MFFWIMWSPEQLENKWQQMCSWEHPWAEPHQLIYELSKFLNDQFNCYNLNAELLNVLSALVQMHLGLVYIKGESGGETGSSNVCLEHLPLVTAVPFSQSALATTVHQNNVCMLWAAYWYTNHRHVISSSLLTVQCLRADRAPISSPNQ